MLVIFSGEGPTDLGQSNNGSGICNGAAFVPGPMAALVDNAIEEHFHYSIFTEGMDCGWLISETALHERAKQRSKRNVHFRGRKQPDAETGFFFINAEMLGQFAKEKEQELGDHAIAILFRDADGTHSAPRRAWEIKFKSIQDGFIRAGYQRGVAMLPKPKSEAWLLCARKPDKSVSCAGLEDLPGNDASPKSAKKQLEQVLGGEYDSTELFNWVKENKQAFAHVTSMPSFKAFADDLQGKLQAINSKTTSGTTE